MSNAAHRVVVGGRTRKVPKRYAVVNGKNRKIYKGYVVVGGKNRLCYMSEALAFTGEAGGLTVKRINANGATYDLYTITKSGTLSLYADNALFWMCGGGAGGASSSGSGYYTASGGGGGGSYFSEGKILSGRYAVVIGAGGDSDENGNPSFLGDVIANGGYTGNGGAGGNGGSGGGGGVESQGTSGAVGLAGGNGCGVSTVPFAEAGFMTDSHCAGGGGGSHGRSGYSDSYGGAGGSDGANGYVGRHNSYHQSGGEKGGGDGGEGGYFNGNRPTAGSDATFYGSGGGGGGGNAGGWTSQGGKGYQGVLYLLVLVPASLAS